MPQKREMHVIPNTHWDREWLYDFQETRMQLVELFDNLLDILDNEPEYKSFLLDSQVAPVEDYLEVRPENKERIRKHVQAGRLLIGPWYTCPEEFNVNGESLIRNLFFGHKIAKPFGHVMKIGYSPFSYGQASQMAQIYAGFGIDSILFYHGVTLDEVPSEFILEGADGTRLLGTRMGSFARYNFFFDVYRPTVYGKVTLEREYKWKEGGLPFHLCGPQDYPSHYFFLDPVKGLDEKKLSAGLASLKKKEIAACSTNVFAYMLGHDSYGPDRLEMELVRKAKGLAVPDAIFMSSLEDYVARLKAEAKDLKVLKGERRTPRMIGRAAYLYHEVTSGRTRTKLANARAENSLQRWAEPFASFAHVLGSPYPETLLDTAWRYLLRCHPHDSIAGTGIDQIERDMSYRLDQVVNISRGVARRAMQQLQLMIDNSSLPEDEVALTVYNPSPFARTEVVTAYVDLPLDCGYQSFSIRDAETGERLPSQPFSRAKANPVLRQLNDATVQMPSEKVGIHFLASGVPGIGYKSFIVKHEKTEPISEPSMVKGQRVMENENVRAEVQDDGTLRITDKASGQSYSGLNLFVDDGEAGMAWRHIPPAFDRVVTSRGALRGVSVVESGPVLSSLRVDLTMRIPLHLDEAGSDEVKRLDGDGDKARRSSEEREMEISSLIILRRGARWVEVVTRFDNRCRDHRLRVAFPSQIVAETCHAESALDVVERTIERGPDTLWVGPWNTCSPQQRFVDVSDGRSGLAILNEGLREYEVSEDASRTILVTLVRAYEIALSTVAWKWERHPEMKLSQCPGEHEFRYAVLPHGGFWQDAGVGAEAEKLNLPMVVAQAGTHRGSLPCKFGLLEMSPGTAMLSAVKRADEGDDLVVRVFNPASTPLDVQLKFPYPVSAATTTDLDEKPLRRIRPTGQVVPIRLEPKKVATLKVGCRRPK